MPLLVCRVPHKQGCLLSDIRNDVPFGNSMGQAPCTTLHRSSKAQYNSTKPAMAA